VAGDT